MTEVLERSGVTASLGADRWAEFEAFLYAAVAGTTSDLGLVAAPLPATASEVAAAGPVVAIPAVISRLVPAAATRAGEGVIGFVLALPMVQAVVTGSLGDGASLEVAETHESEQGGERSVGTVTGTISFSHSGSRIVSSVDLAIQIDVYDGSGRLLRSVTFRSIGTVEIDMCPDENGAIRGHGSLTMTGSSSGGASGLATATSDADVTITGMVDPDAYLQSVEIEAAASDDTQSGTDPAETTAVEFDGAMTMGPQGGIDGHQITRDTGRIVRRAPSASQAQLDSMSDRAAQLIGGILDALARSAQEQWRGGACLEIRSTESSRDVRPSEQVQFTASLHHLVEGNELDKPISVAFSGRASLDPVDSAVPAPVLLSFLAGSQSEDIGTVHLQSTSNRGIASLEVTFRVVVPGWKIDQIFSGGQVVGQKCGDPTGTWVAEGTYERVGMTGHQTWTMGIDADAGSGEFTYVDLAQGAPGGVVTVYMEGLAIGTVTLTIDPDGMARMHMTETEHSYWSWTSVGGQGYEVGAELAEYDLIWEPDSTC